MLTVPETIVRILRGKLMYKVGRNVIYVKACYVIYVSLVYCCTGTNRHQEVQLQGRKRWYAINRSSSSVATVGMLD